MKATYARDKEHSDYHEYMSKKLEKSSAKSEALGKKQHADRVKRGVAELQRIGRNLKHNPRTFIKGTNISMGDSRDYKK